MKQDKEEVREVPVKDLWRMMMEQIKPKEFWTEEDEKSLDELVSNMYEDKGDDKEEG